MRWCSRKANPRKTLPGRPCHTRCCSSRNCRPDTSLSPRRGVYMVTSSPMTVTEMGGTSAEDLSSPEIAEQKSGSPFRMLSSPRYTSSMAASSSTPPLRYCATVCRGAGGSHGSLAMGNQPETTAVGGSFHPRCCSHSSISELGATTMSDSSVAVASMCASSKSAGLRRLRPPGCTACHTRGPVISVTCSWSCSARLWFFASME
mmetsp:Transcript_42775/g.108202  ORF Transcript_42775/g.108202 Transcript_42775/m.108202 type:complete len:204 (+) Transcript_42775:2257-2868(+)